MMKFDLIPSDNCEPSHLAAIHKDKPELTLQTDVCIGGNRNTVFESERDVMDYIAENDGSPVRAEDVVIKPVSQVPGFDMDAPVYIVRRKE